MTGDAGTESEPQRLQELEAEYEILGELGRGGTSVVYMARDRELGRNVAVKVIRSTYVDDPEVVARLVREAKTVAGLEHPKIVTLYGTRRLRDGSVALVMQYVPGLALKEVVRREGPIRFDLAATVLRDIGEALAYAHRRKIVHRDVKPDNIYFDREANHARLSDFGIARPWDSDSGFTLPGMAIGTPAYMSPEQIDGQELDGRSDLYSLGLVGYEMLTGEPPWAGENVYNTIFKQKNEALPPLEDRREGVPDDLELAIRGCLPKERERRWKDVEEFLDVLDGRRPADAAPLTLESWRDLGQRDVQVPAGRDEDDGHAPSGEAETIRFRRDVDVPPRVAEGREEPEETADSPIRAAEGDASTDADEGMDRHAGSEASARGRDESRPRERRRWPLLVAGIVGSLLLGGGAFVYVVQPDRFRFAERALGAFGLPDGRGDAAGDPGDAEGSGQRSDPAELAPVERAERVPEPTSMESGPDAGSPAELSVLSGAEQVAPAGEALPVPITVTVRDSAGLAVSGATVRFAVAGGGGEVIPPSVTTNAAGIAEARWRLGPEAGEQRVVATVEGSASVTSAVRATATPRPPARIALVSGGGQEARPGARLPAPIRVRVTDDLGNPIPDAAVEFRSTDAGGGVDPSGDTTDDDGIAQARWTLGSDLQPDTLIGYLRGEERIGVAVVADVAVPRLAPRPMVASGGTHTCALGASGQVSCWGANAMGQLGTGGAERRLEAARVITGVRFARITGGVSFTCGLSVDNRAYCWGGNESGQLGIGSREPRGSPEAVATSARFSRLGAGAAHACGIAVDGRMLCWGSNEFGQLGDGSESDRTEPSPVAGDGSFSSLAVGWGHTCALDGEGRALCWGRNSSGELGDGTGESADRPASVAGQRSYADLAAGSAHTCGLGREGDLYCWGQNRYGQLGIGSQENRQAPAAVDTDFEITQIVAGGVHTCALAEGGEAYCWGRNAYGQLGDGTETDRSTPVPVAGGHRFTSISTRGAHTCGVTSEGVTRCWGYNSDGQLGNGSRSTSPVPVRSGGTP